MLRGDVKFERDMSDVMVQDISVGYWFTKHLTDQVLIGLVSLSRILPSCGTTTIASYLPIFLIYWKWVVLHVINMFTLFSHSRTPHVTTFLKLKSERYICLSNVYGDMIHM